MLNRNRTQAHCTQAPMYSSTNELTIVWIFSKRVSESSNTLQESFDESSSRNLYYGYIGRLLLFGYTDQERKQQLLLRQYRNTAFHQFHVRLEQQLIGYLNISNC